MDVKKLETWYLNHHRQLSFRETKNPYHIWVSEIMLQQTQVDTVIPYFNRFIKTYPTITDLALSSEEKLIKEVEGLGYYRRFRNMHKAALIIVEKYQGEFPRTYEKIIDLPGVGAYTAGAILSIAYHVPRSAVDGNVIRVLSRYLGNDQDMRLMKNRKELDRINQMYIEKANPEYYTQALMELGATVCKPKNPKCSMCPLVEHCIAYTENRQDELPILSKLKSPKMIEYITLIIQDDDFFYLRKRDEELLKGMYEYLQFESESINHVVSMLSEANIEIEIDLEFEHYKHTFSHQVWHMHVYSARLLKGSNPTWVKIAKKELEKIPMAIAHRKIIHNL